MMLGTWDNCILKLMKIRACFVFGGDSLVILHPVLMSETKGIERVQKG